MCSFQLMNTVYVQVWQSLLKTPVLSSPLGFVDAQTTEPGDFLPVEIVFPRNVLP